MTFVITCEKCKKVTSFFKKITEDEELVHYYCLECYEEIVKKEDEE